MAKSMIKAANVKSLNFHIELSYASDTGVLHFLKTLDTPFSTHAFQWILTGTTERMRLSLL